MGKLRELGDSSDVKTKIIDGTEAPRTSTMVNRSFGRYQLVLEMAQGGMAMLYLALLKGPEQFEKLLVIKRIHDHLAQDVEFVQMFLDEARISAIINHPNVAAVFDMGEADQVYFIAMEYIHGHDLADILRAAVRRPEVFTWSHATRIVAEAAAGLHAAHTTKSPDGRSLQIVHRDISPRNILVSYEGHVKIVDFGIAYAAERLTQTGLGTVKGKASYMSPEQLGSSLVDHRSDVFSLGTVLFEATCLKRLFREETEAATLLKVADAVVPPPRSINPALPAELERIILKALAAESRERFRTAGAMEQALEQLQVSHQAYVGRQELAAMMSELFYDLKKVKDGQIRRALEDNELDVVMPGVAMAGTASTSNTALQGGSVIRRPRRRAYSLVTWLTVAGLSVAALLILFVWANPLSGGTDPAKAPSNRAPPPAGQQQTRTSVAPTTTMKSAPDVDQKAAGRQVKLEFTVQPEEVEPVITFRGLQYPGRRFRLVVPRSRKSEKVVIRAAGYNTYEIELIPLQDVSRIVVLTPKAPGARKVQPGMRRRGLRSMRRRPRPADLVKEP